MKKFGTLAMIMLAGALTTTTAASATGFGVEAEGVRSEGRWGGDLGVGYRLGFAGFDITPAAGAFLYKGDSNGYFKTEDRDGTERCRSANGQFADKDKCNRLAAKAYGRIEIGYTIPLFGRVGAGARYMSDHVRPYGTVSVPLAPKVDLKGNAGAHYFALGATLGF